MKYLGIDYGKKKVGLSISEGNFASPFKVLEVGSLEDAVQKILSVIKKEEIDKVIIGTAESGEAKKIAKNFIKQLKNLTPPMCDIVEVDELLSTHDASLKMIEMGVSKKSRKEDDAYAASIILQNYLDSKNDY